MKKNKNNLNFIEKIVEKDLKLNDFKKIFNFRFPPDPNGYLHIGHAKAIHLNFGLGKNYNIPVNLRFDDTNPGDNNTKIFIKSIKKDIKWLGFNWNKECYTSDYFNDLYELALILIKKGDAYVDDQSKHDINLQRGNYFTNGNESPYRNRSISENIDLFIKMKEGKFKEESCVLRAKIDMNSKNLNLRDPIMYRIINKPHFRKNKNWFIYPTYDWAHGQSDYIEKISHSFCSFEFENHRPIYEWYLKHLNINENLKPKQYEFSRMNISYNILSKRKLSFLIEKKIVKSWDDPLILTISGLRRKGYTSTSIINFCKKIGITKRHNIIDISLLEYFIRDSLKKNVIRTMVVLNPVKLIIKNYPENKTEWLISENNPDNTNLGYRRVPFSKVLYIDRNDFMENPDNNFFRLSIGRKVRLKNAYIIKGLNYIKDKNGNLIEIHCLYYNDSLSGTVINNNLKIKSTLHWVSIYHSIFIYIRLYENLFTKKNIEDEDKKNILKYLNPNAIKIVKGYAEPFLKNSKIGDKFQFQRLGYFCLDKTSFNNKLVFNRTIELKNNKKYI